MVGPVAETNPYTWALMGVSVEGRGGEGCMSGRGGCVCFDFMGSEVQRLYCVGSMEEGRYWVWMAVRFVLCWWVVH